ncbi:MAG: hypothetical protein ABR990_09260 [Terracidiphilus sp.]|jgi:hypothetical protein
MKTLICAALLVFCAVTFAAQSPDMPPSVLSGNSLDIPPSALDGTLLAGPPVAKVHTSDLGFTYSLPSDWTVLSEHPTLPWEQQAAAKYAGSNKEKLDACTVDVLTAGHPHPASIISISAMPFNCIGQYLTGDYLPSLGAGVSRGLQRSLTVANPAHNTYTLGTHNLWIERATVAPIEHPDQKGTLETVCGILSKAAVCWVAFAADDAALKTFEQGAVTLEGEAATALVPADAMTRKPLPPAGNQILGIRYNTNTLFICIGLFAALFLIAFTLFKRWRQ